MVNSAELLQFVTIRTGVELTRGGLRDALEGYVQRRITDLGLGTEQEYLARLQAPDGRELAQLFEVISVPHTWFFRDPEQLEIVRSLCAQMSKDHGSLCVWIPGCATGEDAYSVSLLLDSLGIEAHIEASDLCESSLEFARHGVYSPFSLRSLPTSYWSSFRKEGRGFKVADRVRERVRFVKHNLLDPTLSTPDGWHLVLCRNVFIYFSHQTAQNCAAKLGRSLHQQGIAMFGAGELITQTPDGLVPLTTDGRVVFRRSVRTQRTSDIFSRVAQVQDGVERSGRGVSGRAARNATIPVVARKHHHRAQPPTRASAFPNEVRSAENPNYAAAHAILGSSTEDPLSARLRMMSGIALYSAGDFQRSLHELRAASLLDDTLWPAAVYQGLVLESMGLPDLARAEYRHATRVLKNSPELPARLPDELTWLGPDLMELARRRSA